MSTEERSAIRKLYNEIVDVFHLKSDNITCNNAVYHEIITPGITQPVNQKSYRLPYAQKSEITKQMEQMEHDDIIMPSDSLWNAPFLVVPKKEDVFGTKKYRVVIDFRKLNNVRVGDAFPMPNVNQTLNKIGKS